MDRRRAGCAAAGVPADTQFATKPQLAKRMIERALDAEIAAGWVAGDEEYGNGPQLRESLRGRGIGYVLAVSRDHRIRTHAGTRRAVDLAVTLPTLLWQTCSAGAGSKGNRRYAWALVHIDAPEPGEHRLLIRAPASSRSTAAGRRPRCRWPSTCGWPVCDGVWRRTSKLARGWPRSTSTRCGRGRPGSGGPCSPCSRMPSSPCSPPPNAPVTRSPSS